MSKNNPTNIYGSLIINLRNDANFSQLPEELNLVEISWRNDNTLNSVIQTRGYQLIKNAKTPYGLNLNGVNMNEILKVYFTIVEPNKQISDCFHAYIGILSYLNKAGIRGSLTAKYLAVLRRMLWPETNGLSPVQNGLFGMMNLN